jgi:hypothetical protein
MPTAQCVGRFGRLNEVRVSTHTSIPDPSKSLNRDSASPGLADDPESVTFLQQRLHACGHQGIADGKHDTKRWSRTIFSTACLCL